MIDRGERKRFLLLLTILIISVSGLAYELVAGTMATYLLGQSVTQFSYATGWFLASMGFGSYLSRYIKVRLLETLLRVQIILGIVGGYSAFLMFLSFAFTETVYPVFMVLAFLIGTCVGLEIPILLRMIGKYRILSIAVSDVFTYDYIGALFASLLFPLILLPYLGILRTSLFFGLMNLAAAWILLSLMDKKRRFYRILLILASVFIFSGFLGAEKLNNWLEDSLYQDPIVYSKTTKFQRLVITKWRDDIRLFINSNIQFSTRDEARYHETLIHVPVLFLKSDPETVLILGGGDGLALKEVFKYPSVKKVVLVDLDPEMVELFRTHNVLKSLNSGALSDPRLQVVNKDAFNWIKSNRDKFDLIISDLPDPNDYSLGKLYSVTFYLSLLSALKEDGVFISQATSPTFAPSAFWCIYSTISYSAEKKFGSSHNYKIMPLHYYIPSFGDWGYILFGKNLDLEKRKKIVPETKVLSDELVPSLFAFSKDMQMQETVVNHLDNQKLVGLYEKSWHRWYK